MSSSIITPDQLREAERKALEAQANALPPPTIVHRLMGVDVSVVEKAAPNGAVEKVIVFDDRVRREQWVIGLTLAGAQMIGKELSKPPRVNDLIQKHAGEAPAS